MSANSNPASSARAAFATRSAGRCSSLLSAYPNRTILRGPRPPARCGRGRAPPCRGPRPRWPDRGRGRGRAARDCARGCDSAPGGRTRRADRRCGGASRDSDRGCAPAADARAPARGPPRQRPSARSRWVGRSSSVSSWVLAQETCTTDAAPRARDGPNGPIGPYPRRPFIPTLGPMTATTRVAAAPEATIGHALPSGGRVLPQQLGPVRLMVLATLAAVSLAAASTVLPAASDRLISHLVQLIGAIGVAAVVARGWRTAGSDDLPLRRAVLDVVVVWVVLHALRTVGVLIGTPLPVQIDWALLAVIGLLIVRSWPRLLDGRFSRTETIAVSLDSAAVFMAIGALALFVIGDGAVASPTLAGAAVQTVLFVGMTGSLLLLGMALTPPRGPHGWVAVLVGLPLFGAAQVWALGASGTTLMAASCVLVVGEIIAAHGAATWSRATDPDPRFRAIAARVRAMLPIIAVGLAPLLFILNELGPSESRTIVVDSMLAIVLAIAVVRQTFMLRDREEILASAEAAAEGRHDALIGLQASERRFHALLKHSSDVFLILGTDGTVQYQSPAVERVLGYAPDERLGQSLLELTHPDDVGFVRATIGELVATPGGTKTIELRSRHADGSWRVLEAACWNLIDDPVVRGIVVNYRDITERKALERRLVHDAFHDPLTGLANRSLFVDRTQHALARRASESDIAVLIMDVDDFKTVNDSLGHGAGDQAMIAVAERLKGCLRPEDTVSRIGGDEFAILLEDVGEELVATVSRRILETLRSPFELGGRQVHLSASIGVAFSSVETHTADELMRNADVAMYTAKNRGKARAERFESSMHTAALARLEMKADLERAVERHELRVRYQPVYALRSGELSGFEALIRWRHPTRGEGLPLD